jgi:RNA-directed DNA polymerase
VPAGPDEDLARGIAWGLLGAAEWTELALVSAAARTLGRRHRWLVRVVVPVLRSYRSAPQDRPYELARFLLTGTPLPDFLARARRQGRQIRVRVITTVPGRMGARRWPVPEIDDLPALAGLLELPMDQLSWAADVRGLQRRTPSGPLHLYRHSWRVRPGAVPRLLEAPSPLLRAVLRRVLDRILVWVPVHPAAHGFVRGRSALTNARQHVGAETVVCLDLQTFFATITADRVNGLFRAMGYPEAVAWTLTALCTHQTPVRVLSQLPSGGDSSARHRLRATLGARHLPQGVPSSPALANLAAFGLDRRLAGYAEAAGLRYSRYADDLTFSGAHVAAPRLIRAVTEIARDEGFAVNPDKTRIRHAGERHEVTGLITNQQLSVPRAYHDQLRAVLHDAVLNGPDAANRAGRQHFRSHLAGRVGWVESLNPVRGRRLRAQLDAIVWPAVERTD